MYPHLIKEELSSGLFCDTLLAGYHDGHLRESIDDHKNTIVVALSRRKARHLIDGDRFPRPTRIRQRSIQAFLLDGWFGNDIGGVGSNVLPNLLTKFWPVKILL